MKKEFKKNADKIVNNLKQFSQSMRNVAKNAKKTERALKREKPIEIEINLN